MILNLHGHIEEIEANYDLQDSAQRRKIAQRRTDKRLASYELSFSRKVR